MPRAVVVGGSVGGRCAAVALRAAGVDVTVFEREHDLAGRGAGIVLQPQVGRFLERHGLGSGDDIGVLQTELVFLERSGETAVVAETRRLTSSYGALLGALGPAVDERLGHTVRDVSPGRVLAACPDGSDVVLDADLVVVADGAGSTVRERLLPGVTPTYAGYVIWRGLVDEADLPDPVAEVLVGRFGFHTDAGMQISSYLIPGPLGELAEGRRRLNWVWYQPVPADELVEHLTDPSGRRHRYSLSDVPADRVEERRAMARRVLPPVYAEVVGMTGDPFIQAVTDLRVPRMVVGRAAVIGDAAATPRPHTAYGSAKALLDADALGDAVAAHPGDLDAALTAWEPGQLRLAHDVVKRGQQLGHQYALGDLDAPDSDTSR